MSNDRLVTMDSEKLLRDFCSKKGWNINFYANTSTVACATVTGSTIADKYFVKVDMNGNVTHYKLSHEVFCSISD